MAPTLGGNGVLYKCDRCYDKIAQGGTPACISECPEGVQKIGPRSEIIKEARAAADSGLFVYGIDENGGTNTVYLSPVPFDVIDRALEKGDGKPHMGPVCNSMAGADMMSKAMIIAPLAGIAAAVCRNYNMLKKLFSGEKDNNG